MMLAKAGKKAEQLSEMNNQNPKMQAAEPTPVRGIDQNGDAQMALLHQMSQINRLNQVEPTHSKNIKMTFNSHKDDLGHKRDTKSTKIVMNDVQGPQMHHHGSGCAMAPPPRCCGGCYDHVKNILHCYHEIDIACHAGPSRGNFHVWSNGHRLRSTCSCVPPGPPPATDRFVETSAGITTIGLSISELFLR